MKNFLAFLLLVTMCAMSSIPVSAIKKEPVPRDHHKVIDFSKVDTNKYVPYTFELDDDGNPVLITWEKYNSIKRVHINEELYIPEGLSEESEYEADLMDNGPWSTKYEYTEYSSEIKEEPTKEEELSSKITTSSEGGTISVNQSYTYTVSADVQLGYQEISAIIASIGGSRSLEVSANYSINVPPNSTASMWFVPEMKISHGLLTETKWDGTTTKKRITVYQPVGSNGFVKGRFYLKYY